MALDANTAWEVRSTGNDDNGGGFVPGGSGTDYTQQDAAQLTLSDLACDTSTVVLTSTTGGFTAAMVDNLIQIKSGTNFTTGFYQIAGFTDTNTVTLDRDPTNGSNASSGTGSIGGGLLTLTKPAAASTGHTIYVKEGTYTLSSNTTLPASGGSAAPNTYRGYSSTRTDNGRPTINCGTYYLQTAVYSIFKNFILTGTGNPVVRMAQYSYYENLKVSNTSGTANRVAITALTDFGRIVNCELISTNGYGINLQSYDHFSIYGCYFHDSKYGIEIAWDTAVINCIFDTCSTTGIYAAHTTDHGMIILNNTIYNCGTGIDFGNSVAMLVQNNTISDCTTGITNSESRPGRHIIDYNNFYNNSTDVTNVSKGENTLAVDPDFTDAPNGNFSIGENLKDEGWPGTFPGGLSIGHLDAGAVQREESGGESSYGFVT